MLGHDIRWMGVTFSQEIAFTDHGLGRATCDAAVIQASKS